jgi:ribosomal protein S18 acetylase RimI-like enzyme
MTIAPSLKIRPLTKRDETLLWEAIYHAIHVPAGQSPPPRSIIQDPNISRYVKDWGRRGDFGFAAELQSRRIGVCWLRTWAANDRGYGWVDDKTPELTLAVWPGHRAQGIGTKLLKSLLTAAEVLPGISLSVSTTNPAVRLYERMGFERVGTQGNNFVMVRRRKQSEQQSKSG